MDNPQIASVKRIDFLRVPVDVILEDELESIILELDTREQSQVIVFLSYKDLMRARRDQEYLAFLKRAALVVPVSKSIENGIKFLAKPIPFRFHPFDFIIRILGILEKKRKSIYLLGGKHRSLQTVATNLRASFPTLAQVGRHAGYYPREMHDTILMAVQKASPSVLFLGPGLPGRDKWSFRNISQLPRGIVLWSKLSFDIMSGFKARPSKESFRKGTHELGGVFYNPLKWMRSFSYIIYGIVLLFYKITHR